MTFDIYRPRLKGALIYDLLRTVSLLQAVIMWEQIGVMHDSLTPRNTLRLRFAVVCAHASSLTFITVLIRILFHQVHL